MLPALVLGAALVLVATFGFSRFTLHHDETFSLMLAQDGLGRLLDHLRAESNPPLYYVLLTGWTAVFGTGEAALRALSGVLLLAGVVASYVAVRDILRDRNAALAAGLLYGISDIALRMGVFARTFTLLGLLAVLSTWAVYRLALDGGTRRHAWLFVGAGVLGTFTHYWYPFLMAGQGVAVLAVWPSAVKRVWWLFAAAAAPFALLWTPVLLEQMAANEVHLSRPGVGVLRETFVDFFGRAGTVVLLLGCLAGLALRPGAGVRLRPPREMLRLATSPTAVFLLLVAVVPVTLAFLVSQLSPLYMYGRYTILVLFPYVALAAYFLARLSPVRLGVLLLALVLLGGARWTLATRELAASDATSSVRAVAQHVAAHADPGAVVVLAGMHHGPMRYYLDRAGSDLRTVLFPAELERHPGWFEEDRIDGRAAELEREAAALVAAVRAAPEVWLLRQHGAVTDVLRARLDAGLPPPERLDLRGMLLHEVLIYRPEPAPRDAP